jgi:hypothetical protein
MKKILFIAAVLFCITACNNKSSESANVNSDAIAYAAGDNVYQVEALLAVAETKKDAPVMIRGTVTHTCVHSGKRCFIVGEDAKTSIRIEAKGEIGGFNRELIGSEIAVKGTVRESRLTKEYIDQYEETVKEKGAVEEDGSAETCAAELSNIAGMRDWMKANNKDYYSIYYVDGENYEVVE